MENKEKVVYVSLRNKDKIEDFKQNIALTSKSSDRYADSKSNKLISTISKFSDLKLYLKALDKTLNKSKTNVHFSV